MNEELPEGYQIPIHRSLVQSLFWMGVPRNLFISNLLFAILGGVFLKTWSVLFISVVVHFICKHFGEKDPQFHLVFWRSRNHKSYYYR